MRDRFKVIADWQYDCLINRPLDFDGYLNGLQAIADEHRDKDALVYSKALMLKELAIRERLKHREIDEQYNKPTRITEKDIDDVVDMIMQDKFPRLEDV